MKAFVFVLASMLSTPSFAQIMAAPAGQQPGLIELAIGIQNENRSGYLAKDRSGTGIATSVHLFSPVDRRSFFDI